MRKCGVSMVCHARFGSLAARAGQAKASAVRKTAKAAARAVEKVDDTSQIVVKQRLAIAHVTVDQLPGFLRDLRELRAEARGRVASALRRLAAPPHDRVRL